MSPKATDVEGAEAHRLEEDRRRTGNWRRWGPYLSERQWGTVREDYSSDGAAWSYFPHDQARSRAYRWGEDGLLGWTDREARLCFALALWNEQDPILKERLFGLTNEEGNHGEDVKEVYAYLDSSPSHSYAKALYRYPQARFPYSRLVAESRRRTRHDPEFELADTGIFDGDRYFDVVIEYAKASPDDTLIRITIHNRGPDGAALHVLPTLWFRNTWIWGCRHEGCTLKPRLEQIAPGSIATTHETLEPFAFRLPPDATGRLPELLFTENETNTQRLFGTPQYTPYVKDAFHERVTLGRTEAVNPAGHGTKAAAWYRLEVPAGGSTVLQARLTLRSEVQPDPFGHGFDAVFEDRIAETDAFYAARIDRRVVRAEGRATARQAYAGLLWSKQFYHCVVEDWLQGDPGQPPPPPERRRGRNHDWGHLFARDILSVPDKWEYPWFASWDLAFHMVALSRIDPDFAKQQLTLLLREWYMHPNGQLPAYEFNFADANPPVHAWACWRVYKISARKGQRDRKFLASAFQKLLLNFTWWVNRKDLDGRHVFAGGFLGLDNIGVFDRSKPLPTGGQLDQADGTSWMAFYCSTMLHIAMELAAEDPVYEDMASKFFEHFVAIADALNGLGGTGLWHEDDGFYYDQLRLHGQGVPLRVRSLVGLIPLLAVEVLDYATIQRLPGFHKRMRWFLEHRKDLSRQISFMRSDTDGVPREHLLLAIPSRERLERVLGVMFDEEEFLSPFGIRSLSRRHQRHPYVFRAKHEEYRVDYQPAESDTWLFGGNSNWRGPVWFPINYLLAEALERYDHFYGNEFTIECPTRSGNRVTLREASDEIARRLASLFVPDATGRCPYQGDPGRAGSRSRCQEVPEFFEYFHGDTGKGLGASHQTGWTALAARCIEKAARVRE
ncbi:MAG: glucosidase [Candidatus Riflebacteria bacterium]|nr:glucosidase [Candidatus Riflebacteria bacterium]